MGLAGLEVWGILEGSDRPGGGDQNDAPPEPDRLLTDRHVNLDFYGNLHDNLPQVTTMSAHRGSFREAGGPIPAGFFFFRPGR